MNGRRYLAPRAIGASLKDGRAYAQPANDDESPRQMAWVIAPLALIPWAALAIVVMAR